MKEFKLQIAELVRGYRVLFPAEYQDFLVAQKAKLSKRDNKFLEVKGTDILQRKLGEYPETLHVIFEKQLSVEAHKWLYSTEGSRWFFGAFPEFRETAKI